MEPADDPHLADRQLVEQTAAALETAVLRRCSFQKVLPVSVRELEDQLLSSLTSGAGGGWICATGLPRRVTITGSPVLRTRSSTAARALRPRRGRTIGAAQVTQPRRGRTTRAAAPLFPRRGKRTEVARGRLPTAGERGGSRSRSSSHGVGERPRPPGSAVHGVAGCPLIRPAYGRLILNARLPNRRRGTARQPRRGPSQAYRRSCSSGSTLGTLARIASKSLLLPSLPRSRIYSTVIRADTFSAIARVIN